MSSKRKARRAPGFFFAFVLAGALAPAGAAIADERAALNDGALAASCSACHIAASPPDAGATAIPRIAGLSAARIRDALRSFRSGSRPGTVMPQIARGYDDVQIDRLARYLSAR